MVGPHIQPDIRAALVVPRVLVTVPVARTPRRARKPRTQAPRARRPRAASHARVPKSTASEVGAPGLTTRPSGPHPVGSGHGTDVQALTRRRTLHSGYRGFGEQWGKEKHSPPAQTTGDGQDLKAVHHAARRLAGRTEVKRARLASQPSLWNITCEHLPPETVTATAAVRGPHCIGLAIACLFHRLSHAARRLAGPSESERVRLTAPWLQGKTIVVVGHGGAP